MCWILASLLVLCLGALGWLFWDRRKTRIELTRTQYSLAGAMNTALQLSRQNKELAQENDGLLRALGGFPGKKGYA